MDPRATHRRLRTLAAGLGLALAAAAPPAAAQKRTAPPPFTYVGTLDQGSERYAVLAARDQSVLLVRAGDAIDSEYRVQSIAEERLLVVHVASGAVQTLALTAPATAENASSAPPPRLPDVPEEAGSAAPASEPEEPGARPRYGH